MFIRSEPHSIPCLGHTKVSKMQSHRDTSSSLLHTLLPAGRKKTHPTSPCLTPSWGCLAHTQTGTSKEELLSQLLSSSRAAGQGALIPWRSSEGVSVVEGRRHWGDEEVHQPALRSQNIFSWLWLFLFYSQSVLHSSHTHHSQRNCSKSHWCF